MSIMSVPSKIYIVFHRYKDSGSFQEICAVGDFEQAKEQAVKARKTDFYTCGEITWTPEQKNGKTSVWIGYYISFLGNDYGDIVPVINLVKIQSINYEDGRFSR